MKNMRSTAVCLLLTVAILFASSTVIHSSAVTYNVFLNVNGQRLYFDTQPFIKDSRMFVPVRGVFEKLGASVEWDSSRRKATVRYQSTTLVLTINSRTAYVNNAAKTLDSPAVIVGERAMIPVRFIAENLGMTVNWYSPGRLGTITTPDRYSSLPSNSVLGFTTNDYPGDNSSYSSLEANSRLIDTVATFSCQVDAAGGLKRPGQSQQNTVNLANLQNIQPVVLVHNFINKGFNAATAHSLLTNAANRKALIHNLLAVMAREAYAGVNIDIENVYPSDRSAYSLFIRELKEALTPYGYLTTVSIPAKTSDQPQNSWSGAFDYRQIGLYADRILLMTYDEHYFGGDPGPVASLPWVKSVLNYASGVIPPNKILLGIGAYGYDWASTGNKAIPYRNFDGMLQRLGISSNWDSASQSPYFKYTVSGVTHQVWYENRASLSLKLDLVSDYKLGGIGIWRLGYDAPDLWSLIESKLPPA